MTPVTLTVEMLKTAMSAAGSLFSVGFEFLAANQILLIPLGIGLLSGICGWIYSRVR